MRIEGRMYEVKNHKGWPYIDGHPCRRFAWNSQTATYEPCGNEEHWIGVRIYKDARRVLGAQCQRCGNAWGSFSTKYMCPDPLDRCGTGVISDSRDSAVTCMYANCDLPAQLHHYAPKKVFGQEADLFGVVPLCPEHHRAWHRVMDARAAEIERRRAA